jgi:hypothetical protein
MRLHFKPYFLEVGPLREVRDALAEPDGQVLETHAVELRHCTQASDRLPPTAFAYEDEYRTGGFDRVVAEPRLAGCDRHRGVEHGPRLAGLVLGAQYAVGVGWPHAAEQPARVVSRINLGGQLGDSKDPQLGPSRGGLNDGQLGSLHARVVGFLDVCSSRLGLSVEVHGCSRIGRLVWRLPSGGLRRRSSRLVCCRVRRYVVLTREQPADHFLRRRRRRQAADACEPSLLALMSATLAVVGSPSAAA